MMFKVFILFFLFAFIQSKTLDDVKQPHNKIQTLPLVVPNSPQKENESETHQLESFINDLEVWQQQMIKMANTELASWDSLENTNLKEIDKDLIKKLIENTAKLLDVLMRVGRAILAIVKDVTPL